MTGWSCRRFGHLIPFFILNFITLFFTTRVTPGGGIPSNSNSIFALYYLESFTCGNSGNSPYIRGNRSRSYRACPL
ncbi:hypothetical protein EV424DRAFT_292547 [Suillus variegatus]|nr:hypothetical protein EV424DRAFT_292547 [Suillus variegatus]